MFLLYHAYVYLEFLILACTIYILAPRPSFRKGVIEKVWENAKGEDGLVRDPNTNEVIHWNPGESRKGVWDMGHIPTAKYSKVHEAYMNGKLTTKEFVDWYNDPANYKPELPSNNRSHRYE